MLNPNFITDLSVFAAVDQGSLNCQVPRLSLKNGSLEGNADIQ
jgi:hypothetical protein